MGDAQNFTKNILVKWGTKAERWTLYGPSEPMARIFAKAKKSHVPLSTLFHFLFLSRGWLANQWESTSGARAPFAVTYAKAYGNHTISLFCSALSVCGSSYSITISGSSFVGRLMMGTRTNFASSGVKNDG